MEANKVRELKRLEQEVYECEAKLGASLEKLTRTASLVLGYEVVADLCNGSEIEFRTISDNGVPDDDSCIRVEDILAELKKR